MYILKNAWTSITRNKGRNILMGIIIMVIATASTVALAILSSANSLIKSYEDSYTTTATINMNRSSLMGNFKPGDSSSTDDLKTKFASIPSLTVDEIKNYGDSSYVTSYTYTESVGVNASGLTKATSTKTNDQGGHGPGGEMNNTAATSSDFTLMGYNSADAMSEFLSGTYTITSGSVSTDFTDTSCIINSELATLNNLSVGDTITITDPNDSTKTIKLTISGIYSDNDTESNPMNMFSNSVNTIITNTNVVETFVKKDTTLKVSVSPTYYLTSSNDVDAFSSELSSKGLNEYYTVSSNLDNATNELSSISNLKTFSITFLMITLVIGAVVLVILNMINVRERKYEIGVLRIIGMKKQYVALQFICELFIISFISIVIGLGIGSVVSVPTANALLQNEINNSTTQMSNVEKNFGGPGAPNESSNQSSSSSKSNTSERNIHIQGVANVKKVDSIHAVVNVWVILELLGVGILLTIISSMAAIISIMRFSPLTILKERS